jgi:hypothetical protein
MAKGRRGTTTAEANSLREAILSLPDLKPSEVAARLNCSVQAVRNVRRNPQPDGRSRGLKRTRAMARMRWNLEEAEREVTLDDLVEAAPPDGLLTGLGPGSFVAGDPYADRQYDAYDVARAAAVSAAPEIALLRTQIRQTANQIHAPNVRLAAIVALQTHMNGQIETLVKAIRAERRGAGLAAERSEMMGLAIQAGWGAQGGARPSAAAALAAPHADGPAP